MSEPGTITLKEFISQTVSQIEEAKKAERSIEGVRGVVDFDVSVVAAKEGNAGIKVGVLNIGGELGGKISAQTASHIKFSIQTKGAISPGEHSASG